jgi:hypothetical protein
MGEAIDPDDLHGDAVVAYLSIKVRRNGAMSVEGCIYQEKYALAMLDTARDCIRRQNDRKRIEDAGGLLIPAHDTALMQ